MVFHHDVVHDQLIVEPNRNPFTDHADAKRVPLADGVVRLYERNSRVFLVVIQASRSFIRALLDFGFVTSIPDLHL